VTDSVRSESTAGGLVAGGTGPVTIVTAGAAGTSQQQAITAALTAAATALHRQVHPLDVAPLPASDRAGLSAFAVSGGTVAFAFLPDGFRQVAPWLPNGAIVAAARDVVYFPGANLGHPLLVIGLWLAGSLAVLACVDLLHLAERRRAPEREGEIYATSGTAHLRQRHARRRAAVPSAVPQPGGA
jgi:hypothetical protein